MFALEPTTGERTNRRSFPELCERYFNYLRTDFGFAGPSIDLGGTYINVRYRRGRVGIQLTFEAADSALLVTVNELDEDLSWPWRDSKRVGVDELAALRKISVGKAINGAPATDHDVMEALLAEHARVLREAAGDVLGGDLTPIAQAAAARIDTGRDTN